VLTDLLTTPSRQAASLEATEHRPWPLPSRGWVMGQTWDDLLFAHWRVPEEELRPLVPEALELETKDGSGWLGVTPFAITGLRLRGTLPLPGVSDFLELNVRTYVTFGGKPGIWFFSLDASSTLAVEAARRTYRLPYFRARMTMARRGEWLDYSCSRREAAARPFVWEGRYRPAGPVSPPAAGTLEHFLTERYCLYVVDGDEVLRAEIHHPPWPLQPAEAEIELNTMAPAGIDPGDEEPALHYSARQDVVIWPLEPVG
jgi:uncharacterized protein YqjF (DUF2071 family)